MTVNLKTESIEKVIQTRVPSGDGFRFFLMFVELRFVHEERSSFVTTKIGFHSVFEVAFGPEPTLAGWPRSERRTFCERAERALSESLDLSIHIRELCDGIVVHWHLPDDLVQLSDDLLIKTIAERLTLALAEVPVPEIRPRRLPEAGLRSRTFFL